LENAKSRLIISLDFELHWGVFDTLADGYNKNLEGTREAIKEILELFKKYNISATWATVGMLFNENKEDYERYKPHKLPTYKNMKVDAYKVKVGKNEQDDLYHYAYDVIKLILSYPNQEIGSHSYSHYYCKEEGQTIEQFEDDTKSAVKIAKDKFGIDLKSYVFSKNEINEEYLEVLLRYGFTHFRKPPTNWLYYNGQKTSKVGKIVRYLDSFINLSGKYTSKPIAVNNLIATQGDRFLRPYKNSILSFLMIRRIKYEMLYAAKNNLDYHLWWHPHNFGISIKENLHNLEELLKYYVSLNKLYSIKSLSMLKI